MENKFEKIKKDKEKEMVESILKVSKEIERIGFPTFIELITNEIKKILKIERWSFFEVIEEKKEFQLASGEPEEEYRIEKKFHLDELPALKEALEKKSIVLIENPKMDLRTKEMRKLIEEKQINEILIVPLIPLEKVIGILVFEATKEKKSFDSQEILYIKKLTDLVKELFK